MKPPQFFRHKLISFIIVALLTGYVLTACSNNQSSIQENPEDLSVELTQEVSASGEVVPVQWVTLSHPSGAESIDLKVVEGEIVEQNKVLASNNDERLLAALFQSQSNLQKAQSAYDQTRYAPSEASLAAAKSALANAEANLQRQKDTLADEIFIKAAEADVEAAKANYDQIKSGASKLEIEAALNDVKAAEFALKQSQDSFDIKAPFSGTVVEIFVNQGEAIAAYQPVLTLADLSELHIITTNLSEVDVTKLRVGQTASIYFDALSNQTFTGIIERIADISSGVSTVNYEVILSIDNIPEGLRWGMTAFIIFPIK